MLKTHSTFISWNRLCCVKGNFNVKFWLRYGKLAELTEKIIFQKTAYVRKWLKHSINIYFSLKKVFCNISIILLPDSRDSIILKLDDWEFCVSWRIVEWCFAFPVWFPYNDVAVYLDRLLRRGGEYPEVEPLHTKLSHTSWTFPLDAHWMKNRLLCVHLPMIHLAELYGTTSRWPPVTVTSDHHS